MALSYDPNKLPYPATSDQELMYAILVELRAIRIALQEQNAVKISSQSPVVTKATRK